MRDSDLTVALLIVGGAIAALYFFPSNAQAVPMPDGYVPPDNSLVPIDNISSMIANTIDPMDAFLYMIRSTENKSVPDPDRYYRFYGNAVFSDLSDHPVNTGELKGVQLPDSMCRAAGYPPGCVSTAAGAYQIIRPTWNRIRQAGIWGPRLPDFSPASQDEAARRLINGSGAGDLLISGDLPGAISKASKLWASLPGSLANQRPVSADTAIAYYNDRATGVA